MSIINPVYSPPVVALHPEHQALCHNTLRFIQELAPLIKKAAACKVDCTHYEALRNELRSVNENIIANFCSPNHPAS